MALATRPKPKVHHKKRHAQHHPHTKHYVKTYWPYLPMLGIAVIGIALNSFWFSQRNSAVLGAQSDISQQSLLAATNEERADFEAAPLTLDPRLEQAAAAKAQDMVLHNYWSHVAPDGKTPWDFIASSGYSYQLAGENLAYGFASAKETITAWMNSPEHRENVLNGRFQNVGFGVITAPNFQQKGPQIIIVAAYATPSDTTVTATVAPHPVTVDLSSQTARPVTRIELLASSQSTPALVALLAVTAIAFIVLLTRHGVRWHKAIAAGERFVLKHPVVDIVVVAVIAVGLILTRTTGVIH